jgi:hypothetical protein
LPERADEAVTPCETEGFSSRGDAGRLDRILAQITDPADRAWLITRLEPPWRRRRRRLDERDAAILALAGHYLELGAGRAIAAAVVRDLRRYEVSTCQREQGKSPVGDAKRLLQHQVLTLNGGKGVGSQRVREILAGLAGKNRP